MKKRILWKLTACFAVVLLLFAVVLGGVFLSLFRRHTIAINRTAMEEKANSIAQTLSSFETGGGIGMGHNGRGGYGSYLYFLDELAMAEVWIVDNDMNLITTGHGSCNPSYEDLPENAEQIVQRVLQGEVTYGEEFSSLLTTPSITVGAPIVVAGNVYGAVLLHSPVSGIDLAVRQGWSTLAAGIGVALVLAGLAAVFLSYYFTNPLRSMKTAALRLADGCYDAKTGVVQDDEIGQLAQTIDLLADRLAEAEEERVALDQMREAFFANVSHELRTPVAVLRGSLELLQDGTVESPEEVRRYCSQMLLESTHLERLVNDLLDLSRLQNDQFKLELAEVNLCDVARDATRAIRRVAQNKEVLISLSCPEEACMVRADYGRIRQLLLILLDNGVKFSPKGSQVALIVEQEDRNIRISVTNTGEEISSEELPHIFERFQKTQGAGNSSGTGLGLPIAQQIAQRHGAVVQVSSSQQKNCFWITLPELENQGSEESE